jgi:hypothetical protein
MVCPMEMVSALAEGAGRRLGVPQRSLGPILRTGAAAFVLFFALQMLVPAIHIHRNPHATALALTGMTGLALLVGFLLRDRAFCRGFCPASLMLGTYARGGMLAVRPKAAGSEAGEDPVRAEGDRPCPSLLDPLHLDSSRDCLLCGRCIRACGPGRMGLVVRPPFAGEDARDPLASWPVVLFAMVVSGFVLSELFSEWDLGQKAYYLYVPGLVAGHVSPALGGLVEGIWSQVLLPAALWMAMGVAVVALRGAVSIGDAWRRLALPFLVVVSAGHMAKGLAKVATWAGFVPHALVDPSGLRTVAALSARQMEAPPPLLPPAARSACAVALILVGGWFALRESHLGGAEGHSSRAAVLAVVMMAGAVIAAYWGLV